MQQMNLVQNEDHNFFFKKLNVDFVKPYLILLAIACFCMVEDVRIACIALYMFVFMQILLWLLSFVLYMFICAFNYREIHVITMNFITVCDAQSLSRHFTIHTEDKSQSISNCHKQ